jgi:hypothetical protein
MPLDASEIDLEALREARPARRDSAGDTEVPATPDGGPAPDDPPPQGGEPPEEP